MKVPFTEMGVRGCLSAGGTSPKDKVPLHCWGTAVHQVQSVGSREACEEWVLQLRAEGGAAVEQVGEGMSRLPGPAVGSGRIPGWHRKGNQAGMGEWGRGHRIRTVGFVPRGQWGFSQACSPLPPNHPRASRRGRRGRTTAVCHEPASSHTFVFSQNEKIT